MGKASPNLKSFGGQYMKYPAKRIYIRFSMGQLRFLFATSGSRLQRLAHLRRLGFIQKSLGTIL